MIAGAMYQRRRRRGTGCSRGSGSGGRGGGSPRRELELVEERLTGTALG
jgi:hypothetical protein